MIAYINSYSTTAIATTRARANLLAPTPEALQSFRARATEIPDSVPIHAQPQDPAPTTAAEQTVIPLPPDSGPQDGATLPPGDGASVPVPSDNNSVDAAETPDDIYPEYVINVIYDR